MPPQIADPHALRLLRSMLYGDLSVLTPQFGQYVYYPKVEEISRVNRERTSDLLTDLWKQGYLKRNFYGKVFSCPHCGTTGLRPKQLCPSCQSQDIERVNLIEHMTCGHVDTEKNFLKGEEYVCPKCGKRLRQIGVDYRKPGVAYHCNGCGENNPTPLERWACNVSDHTFPLEEAITDRVFSYVLNEEKRDEILRIFEFIQPIADVFERFGFKTETFYSIIGTSGVHHLVDIYAYKNGDNPVISVVGVLVEEGINPEEVLKLYAISLDIKATITILIAVPKLDGTSKVYAKKFGLTVVEAKDFETVSHRLTSILEEVT